MSTIGEYIVNPDNSTPSDKYYDARLRAIEDAAGIEMYGIPLDMSEKDNAEHRLNKWADFLPFTWCVCVHDSPDSPCPCNGPIVWIPRDRLIRFEQSTRRSQDGKVMSRLLVRRETNVIVEQASRIPVEDFVKQRRPSSPASSTSTNDRPVSWPTYYPWPPANTGPVISAPPETIHESGIQWYEVQVSPETRTANLVAFDTNGKEIARHLTQMISDNESRFVISQNETNVSGDITLNRGSDGRLEIKGHIEGQEFRILYRPDGKGCGEVSGRLCLDIAKLKILNQWGRISHPLMVLSVATNGGKAKKSCFGCSVLLAGVSVGAGCCVTGNLACCAATGIGGSTFIDDCKGACA